jgi:hypothetical protein
MYDVDVSGVSRHAGEHDQPVGGQGEEKRVGRRVCTMYTNNLLI